MTLMILRILFVSFIFLSCSPNRMIETNLYFGQSRPDGSLIKEKEWDQFKEKYILKTFNVGCSIIKLEGAWKDTVTHNTITEPSYLVIYDYKKSSFISKQIDSLCYWYKKLFQQQAVLRVDKKMKAYFR